MQITKINLDTCKDMRMVTDGFNGCSDLKKTINGYTFKIYGDSIIYLIISKDKELMKELNVSTKKNLIAYNMDLKRQSIIH
jgi:hypothetical protein